MNDKVNVEVIVPEIEERYNVFLPINKKMGTVIKLLNKAVNELSHGDFPLSNNNKLYNADNLSLYELDTLLYNTDIRNDSKLILFSK